MKAVQLTDFTRENSFSPSSPLRSATVRLREDCATVVAAKLHDGLSTARLR